MPTFQATFFVGGVLSLGFVHLSPPPLKVGQPYTFPFRDGLDICTRQNYTLHGGGHCTTHQTVEPMVVELLRPDLPLIHRPATALGLHAVLGRKVLSKEPMLFGFASEQ